MQRLRQRRKDEDKQLASAPAIIKFDEKTGAQINKQVEFPKQEKKKSMPYNMPWRQWRQTARASQGALEADKASAVAALHNLHESFSVEDEPIEIMNIGGKISVVTSDKVAKEIIWLPPCIPKQSKVYERSEDPLAVMITSHTSGQPPGREVESEKDPQAQASHQRTNSFYVIPEMKFPTAKEPKAEVAESEQAQ